MIDLTENIFIKSIETKSIEAGTKVLITTDTFVCKCIENTQYKYFLKVLKIQIVLNTKGLSTIASDSNWFTSLTYLNIEVWA